MTQNFKKKLKLKEILQQSVHDCLLSGYVSEKWTLYKNLYQTEAFQFLRFNKQNKKLETINFFYYHCKINLKVKKNQALNKLDKVFNCSKR